MYHRQGYPGVQNRFSVLLGLGVEVIANVVGLGVIYNVTSIVLIMRFYNSNSLSELY